MHKLSLSLLWRTEFVCLFSGSGTDWPAVTRTATDGQHWLNGVGLALGFARNTILLLFDADLGLSLL